MLFRAIFPNKNGSLPPVNVEGLIDECFEQLSSLNKNGYGIFVTINECHGGRKEAHVRNVRAVFVDIDRPELPALPLAPSAVISSGRGHHIYYRADDVPLNKFKEIQKLLIKAFDADKSVCDLPRVMRLPGFFNTKDPANPKFTYGLQYADTSFPLSQIVQTFEPADALRAKTDTYLVINSDFHRWCQTLPAEEGELNSLGGRNKTALILIREGLGQNENHYEVERALREYCARSGLAFEEVTNMLERQTNEHSIKKFVSFVKNVKDDLVALAESYLKDRGHIWKGTQVTLTYWRDDFYEYGDNFYTKIERGDLEADVVKYLSQIDHKKISKRIVNELLNYFKGQRPIRAHINPGHYFGENQSHKHFIPTKKEILVVDKKSGEHHTIEKNPDLFVFGALDCCLDQNAQCPHWMDFLTKALPDIETQNFMQEWFGYNLMHDTSHAKFVILVGEGANGKTVMTVVLSTLLGSQNVSSIPLEAFDPSRTFPLAATIGKLANIVDEIGSMSKVAEGVLKQFVGGSAMSVEHKNRPSFQAKPTARLLFATNNLPRMTDQSDGLWRRLIAVPMTVQFNEAQQDRRLIDSEFWRQSGELDGILKWSLEGLRRLIARGKFSESSASKQLKAQYRNECDSAREYLDLLFIENISGSIAASSLYSDYVHWTRARGLIPVGPAAFSKGIQKRFPHAHKSENAVRFGPSRERVWYGFSRSLGDC